MPKLLLLGVLFACVSGPSWVQAEEPTPTQTVNELRKTLAQNKTRIAALEIRLADSTALLARALKRIEALEQAVKTGGIATPSLSTGGKTDQPSSASSTEIYTLDRDHLIKHLQLMTAKDTNEQLAGKSEAEAKILRKKMHANLRKQVDKMNLQLVLRDDRSMMMKRATELSTGVETGLWSRNGKRLILTITHQGRKALKQPNLIQAAYDGDDLELEGSEFPFPIRMTRSK